MVGGANQPRPIGYRALVTAAAKEKQRLRPRTKLRFVPRTIMTVGRGVKGRDNAPLSRGALDAASHRSRCGVPTFVLTGTSAVIDSMTVRALFQQPARDSVLIMGDLPLLASDQPPETSRLAWRRLDTWLGFGSHAVESTGEWHLPPTRSNRLLLRRAERHGQEAYDTLSTSRLHLGSHLGDWARGARSRVSGHSFGNTAAFRIRHEKPWSAAARPRD